MATTFELISSATATGSTSSVTFSSIPQTFSDLVIKVSDRAATDTQSAPVLLSINGNTSNLSSKRILSVGSGAISQSGTGNSGIGGVLGNGSDFTANVFGSGEVYILNYTSSTAYKSISIDSTNENNGAAGYMAFTAVLWSSNSAITSITLTQEVGNIANNSTFYLYGVKNA